ncbi:hypothetical protein AOG2_27220 [Geobacter sp. AOG2]|nr:hypothetical protein AOG2_27220 [Geobacter sp. AOG2]
MSTFNGSSFIADQIRSIQCQTFTNWVMIVRDDGSTDETLDIVKNFAADDERIQIVTDNRPSRLGPKASFGALMERAQDMHAHYYCFADQDDVWHSDKIASSLERLKKIEADTGADVPVLVYSDLQVVTKDLVEISPSFYAYQGIRTGEEPPFHTLLVQNHIVGCSMMFNRSLLEMATPVPEQAYMHDWWVAICARVRGIVSFLDEPTVKYRQHGGNSAGAGGIRRLFSLSGWGTLWQKLNWIFLCSVSQSESLSQRLHTRGDSAGVLSPTEAAAVYAVEVWGQLAEMNVLERLGLAIGWRLKSQNNPLTILLYIQLLLLPMLKRLLYRPSKGKEK